ncbi:hypothetical protein RDV84_24140 [Lysobacter yananisis]|uniref:Uncharacterized protein n=1 Tax=Lysobacter yananisis TaxID=1003114 RepID=A0ABY9P7G5_9GAMM|nr:hypothetical protein [Lysobacter yananisis]WMT03008.1 hypothetical protein RDV84_24140 [Lysobacter yananisis]
MQRNHRHRALRRAAVAALIVAGCVFSLSSLALPVPPPNGGGWLIYTYYAKNESGQDVVVGMRYQGGCPGLQPHNSGVTTPRFTYQYVSCGQN